MAVTVIISAAVFGDRVIAEEMIAASVLWLYVAEIQL